MELRGSLFDCISDDATRPHDERPAVRPRHRKLGVRLISVGRSVARILEWFHAEEANGLVSPRAVPRVHRDRRDPCSSGRGRDRSRDDDDQESYPYDDQGTEACSAGRDREGGREGNRWLVARRARSFPGLRGISWRLGHYWATDDPQEDDSDPRGSLQNMDSLHQAGRIPGFRLLSRRRWVYWRLRPLAQ